MKKSLTTLLLALLLISCGAKTSYIKKYYFPYAECMSPKVYVYTSNQSDSLNTSYWNFKTFVQGKDTFFTTTVFDKNLKPNTIYVNYIKPDGAYLQKMIYVVQDTIQLTYMVEQNEVFKWVLKENQTLNMFMTLTMNASSQEIYSERSFGKKRVEKQCMGKSYATLEVTDKMNISVKKDNRTSTEERFRTGFFAEGLGLIEFTTSLPNGTEEHFVLEKILNEQEWIKLINSSAPDSSDTATR